MVILRVNLTNVRSFAEQSSGSPLVKVLAILALTACGLIILAFALGHGGSMGNLRRDKGLLPHGTSAILLALSLIMFSSGGTNWSA